MGMIIHKIFSYIFLTNKFVVIKFVLEFFFCLLDPNHVIAGFTSQYSNGGVKYFLNGKML